MEVDVQFKSSGDIENLDVWLTPSLQGMTADPESFDEIKKDVIYTITLTLEEKPTHTIGERFTCETPRRPSAAMRRRSRSM